VLERVLDDRTFAEKSAQGTRSLARALANARLSRRLKFNFGAKSAPRPKPKRESTPQTKDYFRTYMREWRARRKADQAEASPAE
jgi:hypothetical protein